MPNLESPVTRERDEAHARAEQTPKRKQANFDESVSLFERQTMSPGLPRQRTESYVSSTVDFQSSPQLQTSRFPNPNIDGKQQAWCGRLSNGSLNSDERLVDALHRESQLMNVQQAGLNEEGLSYNQVTPSQQSRSSTTKRTKAGVQLDPNKKPKRVFSNRTKTGCMTCKDRKKKCDEAKPECKNCDRGGFICRGYTPKTMWSKPSMQQEIPPVPLQPSESGSLYPHCVDFAARADYNIRHKRCQYVQSVGSNTSQAVEGMLGKPIVVDEEQERPSKEGSRQSSRSDIPQSSYAANQPTGTEYSHGVPTSAVVSGNPAEFKGESSWDAMIAMHTERIKLIKVQVAGLQEINLGGILRMTDEHIRLRLLDNFKGNHRMAIENMEMACTLLKNLAPTVEE